MKELYYRAWTREKNLLIKELISDTFFIEKSWILIFIEKERVTDNNIDIYNLLKSKVWSSINIELFFFLFDSYDSLTEFEVQWFDNQSKDLKVKIVKIDQMWYYFTFENLTYFKQLVLNKHTALEFEELNTLN